MADAAPEMEHVDGREVERLKRSMIPEVKKEHPYVGLRQVAEHRWGGMRLWPKWKSLRKTWKEGYTYEDKTEKEGVEEMEEKMTEYWEEKEKEDEDGRGEEQTEGLGDPNKDACGR